ncbi:putative RNA helicase [Medicago truncatula]|uniref:RNA helicase n=1 Tax=Medicago truncatula TaxID=3880 RepID=A0A396HBX6_MEDTR|nr:putative RNA helicase [Medicago truncatula]
MANDSSFLFAGIHFDRKKFGADIARFQKKDTDNSFAKIQTVTEDEESKETIEAVSGKKRKRKKTSSAVDGFSVFRSSTSKSNEEGQADDNDESIRLKKEQNKQLERDAIFRKNHNIHVSGYNVPSPLQSFDELKTRYKCPSYLLWKLAELGFREPTPIQRQAIPVLLQDRECFACAPTGSGKTLAFVCPMLMKLKAHAKGGVRAVIICHSRELSGQTYRECKKLAKGEKFRIKLMTKNLLRNADFSKFSCDILISTPLRLCLAIKKKKVDLSRVEYLVLDESDKLFEPQLFKQIDSIIKACTNPSIIRSLFSATLPDFVEDRARELMHDAVRVIVGRKNMASDTIKQKLVFTGSEEGKLLAIRQSFAESLNPPVLVFLQSKERAKELYGELAFDNIRVDVIHSDLSQEERENAVDNFRAGKTWVLIATDVVARGMDFKGINCVINYDFPDSASAYIHRIGRSGRAGRSGEAITFYTEEDIPFLRNVSNLMASSGCEVPSWLTELQLQKKKWKKHRPDRDSISTKPDLPKSDSISTKPKLQKKLKKHRPKKDSIVTKPDLPKSDSISTKPKLQKKLKKHRPKKDSIVTKPDLPKSDSISTKPKLQKKLKKHRDPKEILS